jgi:hypothetical protein
MDLGVGVRCGLALSIAAMAAPLLAAEAAAVATATVIPPIGISRSTDLAFGSFAAGHGGTVSVNPDGQRAASGATLSSSGTAPKAARFEVSGAPNTSFSISTQGTSVTLIDAAAHVMPLALQGELAGQSSVSGMPAGGTLSPAGTQTLRIGGTLVVDAAQSPGVYTGIIVVTVDYN